MSDVDNPQTVPEADAAALSMAVRQLFRRLRAEAEPGAFNLSEVSTLARLDLHGPATTASLARAEAMTPQSMGAILVSLERKGLIERHPHPTDRRQTLLALTAAGRCERQRRSAAKRDWLVAAMERLDEAERRALIAAIPLIARLGENEGPADSREAPPRAEHAGG